jgi:general secretion pathway protein B
VSYILDALRKSDQLRRRGAAPTLLLGQATAPAPKRLAPFAYVLLALVLLGIGIAIGWLQPWQQQSLAPTSRAGPAEPAPPRQAPAASLGLASRPELQAQYSAPATPAVPAPAPAPAPVQPRATAAGKSERQKAVAPVQGPALRSNLGAAPVPSVMTMAELPVPIQQELPPLSILVHAYSGKPADRLVDINGHLLHEGEDVAPGLRLEEITPEGMIFSYKGYTFRRGVR